jgi:hypothetical protein
MFWTSPVHRQERFTSCMLQVWYVLEYKLGMLQYICNPTRYTRYIQLFVFNNIHIHCFNYDTLRQFYDNTPHNHTQTDIPHNFTINLIHTHNLTITHTYLIYIPAQNKIRNVQLVNAPEDGPVRSETCRATKCYE